MNKEPYIPIANAITKLFSPLAEVVIHDIKTNTVAAISGSLSGRRVGDPSLLTPKDLGSDEELAQTSYTQLTHEGHLVKSISIPLYKNSERVALMCINCDVSLFETLQTLCKNFLATSLEEERPKGLFENDWQERLHKGVYDYLKRERLELPQLNSAQKRQLIRYLFDHGAFNQKGSADYAAKVLNMGRATLFKYIKQWKTNN